MANFLLTKKLFKSMHVESEQQKSWMWKIFSLSKLWILAQNILNLSLALDKVSWILEWEVLIEIPESLKMQKLGT